MAKERVWLNYKAKTLYTIFVATGKIDPKAAMQAMHPEMSPRDAHSGAKDQFDAVVMAKFADMIRVKDSDLAKMTSSDRILKELCEDINRLNLMLESGEITPDEAIKIMKAKGEHLKLLGLSQGTWKKDLPDVDLPKEDPRALFGRLKDRFSQN